MKTSVLIILTVTVLIVGALAVMNNACKISQHEWCAPTSSMRHQIKTG
jgi:predicted benzoate:H+ symporter BenE